MTLREDNKGLAIAMLILIPMLWLGADWVLGSGMADTKYPYETYANGPLQELYTTLEVIRDRGTCSGSCEQVVSQIKALGPSRYEQAASCFDDKRALSVRQARSNTLTIRCGENSLWLVTFKSTNTLINKDPKMALISMLPRPRQPALVRPLTALPSVTNVCALPGALGF